jgi:hypothetical protein
MISDSHISLCRQDGMFTKNHCIQQSRYVRNFPSALQGPAITRLPVGILIGLQDEVMIAIGNWWNPDLAASVDISTLKHDSWQLIEL